VTIDKKHLIFEAVIQLIRENGFNSSIKISDIANRANIGKGTVYEYFNTKEELMTETILYIIDENKKFIINYDEVNKIDVQKILENLIKRILKTNLNIFSIFAYKDISNFFNQDFQLIITKKLNQLNSETFDYFKAIIEKGISEKIFSPSYTPFEVEITLNTITMSCMNFVKHKHENQQVNEAEFISNLIKMIMKMLT
jgi:AcrR family transcriptional regulator